MSMDAAVAVFCTAHHSHSVAPKNAGGAGSQFLRHLKVVFVVDRMNAQAGNCFSRVAIVFLGSGKMEVHPHSVSRNHCQGVGLGCETETFRYCFSGATSNSTWSRLGTAYPEMMMIMMMMEFSLTHVVDDKSQLEFSILVGLAPINLG
jgi:hypothetical protein